MVSEPIEIETPKRANRICDICNALSDSASVIMFLEGVNTKNGLTKKQYYARLHRLKETGLIRKYHGHYEMTSTGLVVKRALSLIDRALSYKMSTTLRAYDTLRIDNKTFGDEEWAETLFFNDVEIRDILLNEERVNVGAEDEVEIAMYESE